MALKEENHNGFLCAHRFSKGQFYKIAFYVREKKYTSMSKDIYRGRPWGMLSCQCRVLYLFYEQYSKVSEELHFVFLI